jgi:hypothetical protein
MLLTIDVLAIVAALCTAVIFGTDVLGALVMRPAYAEIDDRSLVRILGLTHLYGDRRLPIPGALGVVAAAATTVLGFVLGHVAVGTPAGIGLVLLLIWLLLFNRISLPINKVFIAAVAADEVPPNARALQRRWDSIITLRAVLQGLALTAFCVVIAVAG